MLRKLSCIILIVFVFCTCLSSCSNRTSDAQNAFEQMMSALSSGDLEQISSYYDLAALPIFDEAENRTVLFSTLAQLLQNVTYTIYQTEGNHKEVHINLLISTPDNAEIIDKYLYALSEMTSSAEYKANISDQSTSDYQTSAAERLIQILQSSIRFSEHTLDVTMVKTEGKWMFAEDQNTLFDLLFEDLGKSIAAIL